MNDELLYMVADALKASSNSPALDLILQHLNTKYTVQISHKYNALAYTEEGSKNIYITPKMLEFLKGHIIAGFYNVYDLYQKNQKIVQNANLNAMRQKYVPEWAQTIDLRLYPTLALTTVPIEVKSYVMNQIVASYNRIVDIVKRDQTNSNTELIYAIENYYKGEYFGFDKLNTAIEDLSATAMASFVFLTEKWKSKEAIEEVFTNMLNDLSVDPIVVYNNLLKALNKEVYNITIKQVRTIRRLYVNMLVIKMLKELKRGLSNYYPHNNVPVPVLINIFAIRHMLENNFHDMDLTWNQNSVLTVQTNFHRVRQMFEQISNNIVVRDNPEWIKFYALYSWSLAFLNTTTVGYITAFFAPRIKEKVLFSLYNNKVEVHNEIIKVNQYILFHEMAHHTFHHIQNMDINRKLFNIHQHYDHKKVKLSDPWNLQKNSPLKYQTLFAIMNDISDGEVQERLQEVFNKITDADINSNLYYTLDPMKEWQFIRNVSITRENLPEMLVPSMQIPVYLEVLSGKSLEYRHFLSIYPAPLLFPFFMRFTNALLTQIYEGKAFNTIDDHNFISSVTASDKTFNQKDPNLIRGGVYKDTQTGKTSIKYLSDPSIIQILTDPGWVCTISQLLRTHFNWTSEASNLHTFMSKIITTEEIESYPEVVSTLAKDPATNDYTEYQKEGIINAMLTHTRDALLHGVYGNKADRVLSSNIVNIYYWWLSTTTAINKPYDWRDIMIASLHSLIQLYDPSYTVEQRYIEDIRTDPKLNPSKENPTAPIDKTKYQGRSVGLNDMWQHAPIYAFNKLRDYTVLFTAKHYLWWKLFLPQIQALSQEDLKAMQQAVDNYQNAVQQLLPIQQPGFGGLATNAIPPLYDLPDMPLNITSSSQDGKNKSTSKDTKGDPKQQEENKDGENQEQQSNQSQGPGQPDTDTEEAVAEAMKKLSEDSLQEASELLKEKEDATRDIVKENREKASEEGDTHKDEFRSSSERKAGKTDGNLTESRGIIQIKPSTLVYNFWMSKHKQLINNGVRLVKKQYKHSTYARRARRKTNMNPNFINPGYEYRLLEHRWILAYDFSGSVTEDVVRTYVDITKILFKDVKGNVDWYALIGDTNIQLAKPVHTFNDVYSMFPKYTGGGTTVDNYVLPFIKDSKGFSGFILFSDGGDYLNEGIWQTAAKHLKIELVPIQDDPDEDDGMRSDIASWKELAETVPNILFNGIRTNPLGTL
jgi:hypothetical protein